MKREEQIEAAVDNYTDNPANYLEYCDDGWEDKTDIDYVERAFIAGIEWADEHQNHWHDAQGDDLPEIDKEVIVLLKSGKVCFAHRPVESYTAMSITNHSEMEEYYPERYDKGGWSIPNIKWWCDINLPKEGGEE